MVHVNYEVTFVGQQRNEEEAALNDQRDAEIADLDSRFEPGSPDSAEARKEIQSRYSALVDKLGRPHYTEIVDHIDRIADVAGIDHVGLGSDFDGCRLPTGMDDCTRVPLITEELVKREYSDADIRKILGENTLRVMEEAIGE